MAKETRTILLDCDERYPFYRAVREPYGTPVEVDAALADRWSRVMRDFELVQQEMAEVHRKAHEAAAERARIKKAEAEVAEAQRRLEKARYEQAYPPYLAGSWLVPGDDAPCKGWQYQSHEEAKAERMQVHNTWPSITFDLKPYVCHAGHHHLRRRA